MRAGLGVRVLAPGLVRGYRAGFHTRVSRWVSCAFGAGFWCAFWRGKSSRVARVAPCGQKAARHPPNPRARGFCEDRVATCGKKAAQQEFGSGPSAVRRTHDDRIPNELLRVT